MSSEDTAALEESDGVSELARADARSKFSLCDSSDSSGRPSLLSQRSSVGAAIGLSDCDLGASAAEQPAGITNAEALALLAEMTLETEALRDIIERLVADAEADPSEGSSSTKSAAGSAALARAHAQKTSGKSDATAMAMLRAQLLDAEALTMRAEAEAQEAKAALAKERQLREEAEARLKAAEAKLAAKGEQPDDTAGSAAEAAVANAIAAASAGSSGDAGGADGVSDVSDDVARMRVGDADGDGGGGGGGGSGSGGKGGKQKAHKGGLEGFMEGIKNILPKSHDHPPKMSSA